MVEKLLQIPVEGAHFVGRVHGVVGRADFPEPGGAHQLEKAQAGFAVGGAFKIPVFRGQDLMSGFLNGAVAFDVGVDQAVEIGQIALELSEIASGFVAGEGRREHKGGMAEEVVFHIGKVGYPIARFFKNPIDKLLLGRGVCQRAEGDLFQIDRSHPVGLPMPGRLREGEENGFLRQAGGQLGGAHVIAHEEDGFGRTFLQRGQDGVDLGVAQDDEDQIVGILGGKRGHDRQAGDRGAGRKLVLDFQPVFPDRLRPRAAGEQGDVFFGAKEIAGQIAAEHTGAINQNFHGKASFFILCFSDSPPRREIRGAAVRRDPGRRRWRSRTGRRRRRWRCGQGGHGCIPWRRSPHCKGRA